MAAQGEPGSDRETEGDARERGDRARRKFLVKGAEPKAGERPKERNERIEVPSNAERCVWAERASKNDRRDEGSGRAHDERERSAVAAVEKMRTEEGERDEGDEEPEGGLSEGTRECGEVRREVSEPGLGVVGVGQRVVGDIEAPTRPQKAQGDRGEHEHGQLTKRKILAVRDGPPEGDDGGENDTLGARDETKREGDSGV